MSSFDSHRQESLKRMWQERRSVASMDGIFKHSTTSSASYNYRLANNMAPTLKPFNTSNPNKTLRPSFSGGFDDISAVIPPVTVVLEGRSICHRISLHKHGNYESLARALRQMFMDIAVVDQISTTDHDHDNGAVDLSNAVPGHLIAYEDMENDLLLVGDLKWKDFVRVAKRIRILPAKDKSRKKKKELN